MTPSSRPRRNWPRRTIRTTTGEIAVQRWRIGERGSEVGIDRLPEILGVGVDVNGFRCDQALGVRGDVRELVSCCRDAGVAPRVEVDDGVEPQADASVSSSVQGEESLAYEKAEDLFDLLRWVMTVGGCYWVATPLTGAHMRERRTGEDRERAGQGCHRGPCAPS